MPTRYDALRTKIYGLLADNASFTRMYDAREAEMRSWRDMVQRWQESTGATGERLQPPWCAVEFGQPIPTNGEYGVATDFETVPVIVYLVYDWDDGSGGRMTVDQMFEKAYGEAFAVRQAIHAARGVEYGLVDHPVIDGSTSNEPNKYFLETRIDLYGVVVEAQCIIGDED